MDFCLIGFMRMGSERIRWWPLPVSATARRPGGAQTDLGTRLPRVGAAWKLLSQVWG